MSKYVLKASGIICVIIVGFFFWPVILFVNSSLMDNKDSDLEEIGVVFLLALTMLFNFFWMIYVIYNIKNLIVGGG